MKPLNVVLITVDSLRHDVLARLQSAAAGRSTIASLAKEGCYFSNAVTASNTTVTSLVSILTSQYPEVHRVWVNGMSLAKDAGSTLPEVLKKNGYLSLGAVSAEHLSSPFGIARGFTHFVNNSGFDRIYYFLNKIKLAGKSLAYVLNVVRERFHILNTAWSDSAKITKRAKMLLNKARGEPFFLWLHYFDVHQYSSEKEYNQKIHLIDGEIKDLLSHLQKLDRLDDTLVVLTADHGEAFGEHGFNQHGWCLYDEVVRVPLVFYCKKVVPATEVKSQVRTIDIAPTILNILGGERPKSWQGDSLWGYMQGSSKDDLLAKSFGCLDYVDIQSVRSGRWKLIYSQKRGSELYDLKSDAAEQNNLSGKNVEIEQSLQKYLADAGSFARAQDQVDDAVKERLKSLGYFDESL